MRVFFNFYTKSTFWLVLAVMAFVFLPTTALDYGLLGATSSERANAMGWHSGLTFSWFLLSLFFASFSYFKQTKWRSYACLVLGGAYFAFVFGSARMAGFSLGYATLFYFACVFFGMVQSAAHLKWFNGDRFLIIALSLVILIVSLFIFYPMIALIINSLEQGNPFEILQQHYLVRLLINSFSVSLTVGATSTFLGLIFAFYTTRIAGKYGLMFGKLFSILPMVTPPFVVSLGVVLMFGRAGYVTNWLVEYFGVAQNWLYGFMGITLSHTLALTPMAFMILEGALKANSGQLEEASSSLKANDFQTLCNVSLPLLKPALANAFLVITIQSLADFSTPFVLGGDYDVIASQIYFYIIGTQLDYASASTLGILLLLFSLVIFLIQYYWIGQRAYTTVSGKGMKAAFVPLPRAFKGFVVSLLILWGLFTALLYGSIFYGSFTVNWGVDHHLTFNHYLKLFGQGLDQGAFPSLIQTLWFALCAAPITAILGFLMAYLLISVPFKGKQSLEFIALLSFSVPGTVAGVSYILAFNHSPIYLTGTGVIIVLSMITRNMPIGMRACIAALKQMDKSLNEASLSLRASRLQTLRYVVFPLLKPALLSAIVSSFVRSMTTISAVIFLVSPSTRVATSYILNRVEDGSYGLAVAYGATLIVVMMLIIFIFNLLINLENK